MSNDIRIGDDIAIKVEIGTSAEEMGRRFVDAWERAASSEFIAAQRTVIFETAAGLFQGIRAPANDRPDGLDEAELMAARKAAAAF